MQSLEWLTLYAQAVKLIYPLTPNLQSRVRQLNRTLKWLLVAVLYISSVAIPVFATPGSDTFKLGYGQSHYTSAGWHQAGSDMFFVLTSDPSGVLTRFEIQYQDQDLVWRIESPWVQNTPFTDYWTTQHNANYRFRTENRASGMGNVSYCLQWDFYNEAR